jgi:hypothetical protein
MYAYKILHLWARVVYDFRQMGWGWSQRRTRLMPRFFDSVMVSCPWIPRIFAQSLLKHSIHTPQTWWSLRDGMEKGDQFVLANCLHVMLLSDPQGPWRKRSPRLFSRLCRVEPIRNPYNTFFWCKGPHVFLIFHGKPMQNQLIDFQP